MIPPEPGAPVAHEKSAPDMFIGEDGAPPSAEQQEEDQYYLSGLFNIESSPAFKFLESLKESNEIPAHQ